MDSNTHYFDHPHLRSSVLEGALQIGLVALLLCACTWIILPFISILLSPVLSALA